MNPRLHATSSHPDRDRLTAFAQGRPLSEADTAAIESHLTNCADCQQRIQDVAPDEFLTALSGARPPEPVSRAEHRLVEGYQIVAQLGSGGAGVVYRARQPGLGRDVALKLLRSGQAASPKELERWRRETRTLAALDHPHIVKVHDAGEQQGTPFLAMELVEGATLADVLADGPLASRHAAALVADLAGAMEYAHQHQIIHRDLKPGNILVRDPTDLVSRDPGVDVDRGSPAKIADFGLSRWLIEESQTCTGDPLGTPSYMAPEQVRGAHTEIGPATDVYGLGCILYECLTGRPVFQGASAIETMQLVLDRDAPSIVRQRAAVPHDLDAICMKCLEKDPARRYATAGALEADLRRFVDGRAVIARKPSGWRVARMWMSRNPWLATSAALLLAAPLVASGALLWHNRSIDQQRSLARQHYAEARATIWEMLDVAKSHSSFEIPRLREMGLAQAEKALTLFERLAEQEHTPEAMSELARIRLELGTAYVALGQYVSGERQLAEAVTTLESLETRQAESREVLVDAMTAKIKLSVAWTSQQRFEEALAVLKQAIRIGQSLLEFDATHVSWLNSNAWAYHALANNHWHLHDFHAAVVAYEQAIAYREQALPLDPQNRELALLTVESRLNLAQVQAQLGQAELARDEMERAIDQLDKLLEQDNKSIKLLTSRALACLNLSNVIAALEGNAAAVRCCHEGIVSAELAHSVEPSHAVARDVLFRLSGNRGLYRMGTAEQEAAISDWQRAIELAPDEELRDYCRTMLVRCLTLTGDLSRAADVTSELTGEALSPVNRFRVAAAWGGLAWACRDADSNQAAGFGARSLRALYEVAVENPLASVPERPQLLESSEDFWAARQIINACYPAIGW